MYALVLTVFALAPLPTSELGAHNDTSEMPELAPISSEQKHVAEAASLEADKVVDQLEAVRDEAWKNARGSLAIMSDPPIKSASVYAMLRSETERFAKLEDDIKKAKAKAVKARRIADLTSSAWDASKDADLKALKGATDPFGLPSQSLDSPVTCEPTMRSLRTGQEAAARLSDAHTALANAKSLESELLKELKLEHGRKVTAD